MEAGFSLLKRTAVWEGKMRAETTMPPNTVEQHLCGVMELMALVAYLARKRSRPLGEA